VGRLFLPGTAMGKVKLIIRKVIKVVAVMPAAVFVLVPPGPYPIPFFGSIVVLLICLVVWLPLFGDGYTGWWPDKPNKP
jgi:hypothetical protein